MGVVRTGVRLRIFLWGLCGAVAGLMLAGCDQSDQPKQPAVSKEDAVPPPADRIAILVTGWGSPQTPVLEYAEKIREDSIIGKAATSANEACTDDYVGTFPFRSEKGLLPYAVAFKVKGLEKLWDGSGVYRRSSDGQTFVSIVDPKLVLTAEDIGEAEVSPLREDARGISTGAFQPDPRTGVDYMADIVKVKLPNGLHDVQESAMARYYWIEKMMGWNPSDTPRHDPMTLAVEKGVGRYMAEYFGDKVDTRFGYYAAIPGVSEEHDKIALDFAGEGYRKMVLARETTDHNNYANNFMDLYPVRKALCKAGYGKGEMAIDPVRQVGRTPEYNTTVVRNLRRYMDAIKPGSEVSVIYTTWGLPWPGGNPNAGPFSTPQPYIREVFHESAYLNFLSFKAYALAAFDQSQGGAYKLNFTKSGGVGGPNARTKALFAYAKSTPRQLGYRDDPLHYTTVRQNLEKAILDDGRKEIIILLSHWYNNSSQTGLDIRMVNDLPLNSVEEMKNDHYSKTWCERYTAPGAYEQMVQPGSGCPNGFTRIQLTETFNDFAQDFTLGYANRIRGGVERFGVFPDLGIRASARGDISKERGGGVEVSEGPLRGVRLVVQPDPRPDEPEGYQWENRYRPESDEHPNTGPQAVRAINDYVNAASFLDSAKDDFTAYIGTQALSDPQSKIGMPVPDGAVSPVVLIGPYRTIVNAPARVTLPYDPARVAEPAGIRPYIYNELTGDFDPVYPVVGGTPLSVDGSASTVSFDVQVFGNFVLVAGE